MCGITGIMTFGGRPIDLRVLERMTATLAHRGPDAQGVVRLATGPFEVALGHTRLRVIDLTPAAEQPMQNADQSISVTFNGEIYNYRELRAELVAQGVAFKSASDTEVIVHLYERYGEACLDRLDGMWALAIWDARRRRLVIARDRAGKKPLYYAERPGLFAFASEIKALLQYPAIDTEMNASAVPAFFLYGYVPNPATLYRGIVHVPPGPRARRRGRRHDEGDGVLGPAGHPGRLGAAPLRRGSGSDRARARHQGGRAPARRRRAARRVPQRRHRLVDRRRRHEPAHERAGAHVQHRLRERAGLRRDVVRAPRRGSLRDRAPGVRRRAVGHRSRGEARVASRWAVRRLVRDSHVHPVPAHALTRHGRAQRRRR